MAINTQYVDPILSLIDQQSHAIAQMHNSPPETYQERLATSKTLDAYSSIINTKITEIRKEKAAYQGFGATTARRQDATGYNVALRGFEDCEAVEQELLNFKNTELDPAIRVFHVTLLKRACKSKITMAALSVIGAVGYTYLSALAGQRFLPN